MASRHDGVPVLSKLPSDIYFRHAELEPAEWEAHSHSWGQFNYVARGTLNFHVDGKNLLSPPQYAIWIPPHVEHASWNTQAASFRSVYISERYAKELPSQPCALAMGPVLKAILDEFARIDVREPNTIQEKRMAQVALDQILAAEPTNSYLPFASSAMLQSIMDEAKANLHRQQTTEQIAYQFNLTTRTLERKCKMELGIGFGEWRQRLRYSIALDALSAGRTIQQISYDLGYNSPSAFISMFRRLSGQTPEQYRRSIKSIAT